TRIFQFPDWNVGPESTYYEVAMWHNCPPDERVVHPVLVRVTMASASVMRVAIELPEGSIGRTPPNACYALDSLCDVWGWTGSIVSGVDIDELSELANYDVVATGASGFYGDYDHSFYDDALLDWVRSGGGLVTTGWVVRAVYYGAGVPSPMDSAMAVSCVDGSAFVTEDQVRITNSSHPITDGVADFDVQGYGEYANSGLWPGAVSLGDYTAQPGRASVACKALGSGRSVYLGPIYMADFSTHNNEPYYQDPNSVRLLKQALEWAGLGIVGVQEPGRVEPARAEISSIRPNPVTGRTVIRFLVPKQGSVEIGIYDLAGKKVCTLASGVHAPGSQQVTWSRLDDAGRKVPAGVYFCQFEAEETAHTRKLVVE
ncbi:MAG: T9SS type A sorting domain-containing protein, partial [candidate division WOR-3 bacterium]